MNRFNNAHIIYDEINDTLVIRNCQARNKCQRTVEGKRGILAMYDIADTPCAIQIPEASWFFVDGVNFLKKFTYYDLT